MNTNAKQTSRNNGSVRIVGYVNIPGRESRPVITPRGKVNEVIEQRAFQRAIDKADNIDLLLDHSKKLASTKEGTLKVYEDAVGLRAEATVTDENFVKDASGGKLKGWSFNMFKVKDEIEERAGKLPLRIIKDFTMTEVTLAMRQTPYYASSSIELRAEDGEGEDIETRSGESLPEITVIAAPCTDAVDYSAYENKIKKIKENN